MKDRIKVNAHEQGLVGEAVILTVCKDSELKPADVLKKFIEFPKKEGGKFIMGYVPDITETTIRVVPFSKNETIPEIKQGEELLILKTAGF
jgi:hypothetical protein